MATYPVVNKETGEQKEVVMSVNDWDQWERIIPTGVVIIQIHQQCPSVGEVGEWKDKLRKKTSWNDVLRRAGKVAGSRVKKL